MYDEGISYSPDTGNTYSEPTMQAVVQFQAKYGISQTGYVGPLTRAKLNALYGCGTTPPPAICSTINNTCTAFKQCCPGLVCGPFENPSTIPVDGGTCVLPSSVTINSVSGPNSLNVSQTGTWIVNATAPVGTTLTYSVNWGDMVYPTAAGAANVTQTSTFTHSYSQAGTYTVRFEVRGPKCPYGACDSDYAQSSITVVVGNAIQCQTDANCPSMCPLCAVGSTTCGGCVTYKCLNGQCVANTTSSITVISPNGGEQWAVGSTHNITWTSDKPSSDFRVTLVSWISGQYNVNLGDFSILSSMSQYSSNITIPSNIVLGNQYKIAVTDLARSVGEYAPNDSSDNYFSIVVPTIQLTTDSDNSPDYLTTPLYNITPERYPDLFVKGVGKGDYLGGGPCIYGTEPNPTSCKPTTDNYTTYYDHCASINQLNEAYVSNGKLGAHGVSCPNGCENRACKSSVTTPSITVTSPDTLIQGQTYRVRWTSTDPSSSDIISMSLVNYSGSTIYNLIDHSIARGGTNVYIGTGAYDWTVPSEIGPVVPGNYRLKLVIDSLQSQPTGYSNNLSIVAPTTGACSDTDGGSNIYTKGTLTIFGNSGSLIDSCQTMTGVASYVSADSCSGTTCYLEEAYCASPSRSYRLFPADYISCPQGCSNGACLTSTPTPTANYTVNNQTTGSFKVGDAWTLRIATNPAMGYQPITICTKDTVNASHPTTSCTPAGQMSLPANTDGSGNWVGTGSFPASTIGNWIEYAKVGSGSATTVISNDISFTVNATTTPSITVTSPNGGEVWKDGETHTITWQSERLSTGANIIITLYDSSIDRVYSVATVSASLGTYTWTIPATLAGYSITGSQFKIYITDIGDATRDSSDNYFTISAAAGTPACADSDVTSAYPDGKNYNTQGTITVGAITGSDHCTADGRYVYEYFCSSNTADNRGYDFVSYTCPNGCLNGACIVPTTTTPTTVTYSPVGNWVKGTSKTINWTTSSFSSNVEVWLCTQSNVSAGVSVAQAANTYCSMRLGNNLANTGSVAFTTPASATAGTTYYFYVRKYGDSPNTYAGNAFGGPVAVTEATTTQSSITVISPNGGETINISNPFTVTFKPIIGKIHYIDLFDFTRNAGYSLARITGQSVSSQSVEITIPSYFNVVPGSSFKIEIRLEDSPTTYDRSDNYFTIVAPGTSLNYSQSSLASIAAAIAKITAEIQAILLNK